MEYVNICLSTVYVLLIKSLIFKFDSSNIFLFFFERGSSNIQ